MSRPTLTFKNNGDAFSGMASATKALREAGYTIGGLERNSPVAVYHDVKRLTKWRYLTPSERNSAHAVITWSNGCSRTGDAIVTFNPETDTGAGPNAVGGEQA